MRKGNLLIIDDEQDIVEIIKDIMTKFTLNIHTAPNVEEALIKLKSYKFHLIISDINMPKTSGVEFLKIIRSEDNQIPLIFFTGYGTKEVMQEAAQYNAFDVIEKPFFYQLEEIALRAMQHGLRLETPSMPMEKLPHVEITKYQLLLKELKQKK